MKILKCRAILDQCWSRKIVDQSLVMLCAIRTSLQLLQQGRKCWIQRNHRIPQWHHQWWIRCLSNPSDVRRSRSRRELRNTCTTWQFPGFDSGITTSIESSVDSPWHVAIANYVEYSTALNIWWLQSSWTLHLRRKTWLRMRRGCKPSKLQCNGSPWLYPRNRQSCLKCRVWSVECKV